MIIKKFITIFGLLNTNTPPIGNVYGKHFRIPLIGKQYIETEYINKSTAFINLKGVINSNGTSTIFYNNNNEETFILSDNLIKTMNKFKCKIKKSFYNINDDNIILHLCFKSIISKIVILERIIKE